MNNKNYGSGALTRHSSPAPQPKTLKNGEGFVIASPKEKIEMYSPAFYGACTIGGILSCGLTHMAVTPLDLVKCNMQVSLSYTIFLCFVFLCIYTVMISLVFTFFCLCIIDSLLI